MNKIAVKTTITYTVNIVDYVSPEVEESIKQIIETYPMGFDNIDTFDASPGANKAIRWIKDHCIEQDAISWTVDVGEVEILEKIK